MIVEGVNRVKKHTKAGDQAQAWHHHRRHRHPGEAPIHVSNVMRRRRPDKKPTRVGLPRRRPSSADGGSKTVRVRVAARLGKGPG